MNKTFKAHTRQVAFLLSVSERQAQALFAIRTKARTAAEQHRIRRSGQSLIKKGLAVTRGSGPLVESLRITDTGLIVCSLLRRAGFAGRAGSVVVPIRAAA